MRRGTKKFNQVHKLSLILISTIAYLIICIVWPYLQCAQQIQNSILRGESSLALSQNLYLNYIVAAASWWLSSMIWRRPKVFPDFFLWPLNSPSTIDAVGDIAPRENIPKSEKKKLEAVCNYSDLTKGDSNLRTGSYAKFCAWYATW